jgi:mono/diheme cytochrome c family protein
MKALALLLCALLPAVARGEGKGRPLSAADAAAGKQAYLRECSACHGERGRGDGPAAAHLLPRPRDFTSRMFKVRTTPSGEPPATSDLLRVLERGLPGSSMPSFQFLPEAERRRIAAYVLQLSDMLDEPEPAPVGPRGPAPRPQPASIERGKALYAAQGCGSCHGPLGRGDGPSAMLLKDDEGRPISVRDLTSAPFRGGSRREDIYDRLVTGMDGSPMPSFAETLGEAERWALADYVVSLQVPVPPVSLPKDPIQAGRLLADRYGCRGCHVLDDGKGGPVGPDLRISGQKLDPAWVRTFLVDPRAAGKLYPWRPHRMPALGIQPHEAEALAAYLQAMGKRSKPPPAVDVARFPPNRLAEGQSLYGIRCADCHSLKGVLEIPALKQQGPELSQVNGRLDFEWAARWIHDPKKIDPKTRMTTPGLTAEQARSVAMFIWKISTEQQAAAGGGATR